MEQKSSISPSSTRNADKISPDDLPIKLDIKNISKPKNIESIKIKRTVFQNASTGLYNIWIFVVMG